MDDIIGYSIEDLENGKEIKEYKGQLENPKLELENSINRLILDFQQKYNTPVILTHITEENSIT